MSGKDIVSEKIANKNFQYWLKANLAINITKSGIEECVENEIGKFHAATLDSVRTPQQILKGELCNDCLTENVLFCPTRLTCSQRRGGICPFHETISPRPCPIGICDKLREKIRRSHENNSPSWKNTRAERWCANPWELAKCYMPPDGYWAVNSFADTDLNGILSVIMNHSALVSIFGQLETAKAREVAKELRHSPDMLLSEHKLMDFLNKLIRFLSYSSDKKAIDAVQQINQMRSETLTISTNDVTKVLQDVIRENTEISIDNIDKASIAVLNKIKESLDRAETTISSNLDKILTAEKSALAAIDLARINSLQKIEKATEENYQTVKIKMQQDLITFNKITHGKISFLPLLNIKDIPLMEYYVLPEMKTIETDVTRNGLAISKKIINDINEVLKESNKEIYIAADAGLGKSAFCKYLAITWCLAHHCDDHFNQSNEETQNNALKTFDFLFLVSLRDAHSFDCEVDDMINNQVLARLAHSHLYTTDVVEEILSREKCLIILDGIDEWSHPVDKPKCKAETPHRKARENCTIITTTKPWKLSVLHHSNCNVDTQIEITQLNDNCIDRLVRTTISKFGFDEKSKIEEEAKEFKNQVDKMHDCRVKTNPMMLTYLLCLWRNKKDFGHSNCEIHCNIVGLLLLHMECHGNFHFPEDNAAKKIKLEMPHCVYANPLCRKYYGFLLKLGHLAFKTYFDENDENSRYLDIENPLQYLSEESLNECLAVGLLTQNRLSGKEGKISFQHISFQEFFAALYIQAVPDYSGVIRDILKVCTSIERVLAMSDLVIYLSGLDPRKASSLSKELCKINSRSEVVRWYRGDVGSWNHFVSHNETVKQIQDFQIACVKESTNNEHEQMNLYIEDFIIDEDSLNGEKFATLQYLLKENEENMKSLKVRDVKTTQEFHDLVKDISAFSLVKLDIKCEFEENDIIPLLKMSDKSLKCFVIKGGRWQNNKWFHKSIVLSNACYFNIWNIKYIEQLHLRNIEMTHEQLGNLNRFISTRPKMKQIAIQSIQCRDHGNVCEGEQLDLSNHKNLEVLEIGCVLLSGISVNVSSLKVCYIGNIPVAGSCLQSLFNCLRIADSIEVFSCGLLENQNDVESLLQTIPHLVNAQYIWLANMDFGTGALNLSSGMKKLQKIVLINVSLSSTGLKTICKESKKIEQIIIIGLIDCKIFPQEDYERLKKKIRDSKCFKVTIDNSAEANHDEFVFETKGIGKDDIFEDVVVEDKPIFF